MKKCMKIWALLLTIVSLGACDDETSSIGDNSSADDVKKVDVMFQSEGITCIKDQGNVLIPVQLSEAAKTSVKVYVSVNQKSESTSAREGFEYAIVEKVLDFLPGETIANVELLLNNDGKTDVDKTLELQIAGAFGAGAKAAKNQTCKVTIVNNAFIEFDTDKFAVWEADGEFAIPVKVTGSVMSPVSFSVNVVNKTAIEGEHFTVESKEITVNPGEESVWVKFETIDDELKNVSRYFTVELAEVADVNLRLGVNNLACEVQIKSEEEPDIEQVYFEQTSKDVYDLKQTLYVPICISKALGGDVKVKCNVRLNSTAIAGIDYEIDNLDVVIPAGENKAYLILDMLDETILNNDRELLIGIESVEGEFVRVADENTLFALNIINNDVILLSQSIEEREGDANVTIKVNPSAKERILSLAYNIKNTVFFKEAQQQTIIVPANVEEVTLPIHMGLALDFPTEVPTMEITVTALDGVPCGNKATIEVERSTYRKMLGEWQLTCTPNNCAATAVTLFEVKGNTNEEKLANFGKTFRVTMKKIWESNKDVYIDCEWNASKPTVINLLLRRLAYSGTISVNGNTVPRFAFWSPNTLESYEASLNLDKYEIKIAQGNLGIVVGTESTIISGAWGMFLNNVVITKK